MLEIKRTNSKDADFIELVASLDAELKIRDGDDHSFYNQFNSIEQLHHCLVAYKNNAIGCGALKPFDTTTLEIKRMYVLPTMRGRGIASQLLKSLETWAKELGYARIVLETGYKQPEAIALYKKSHFKRISNYGPYSGVENSLCFEKMI